MHIDETSHKSKAEKGWAWIFTNKAYSLLKLTPSRGKQVNSFAMMWRFAKDKAIEMTNNLAERQLRKYVIYRKKLLFTWSEWGNEFVERIQSLYLSSRLSKRNPFSELTQLYDSHTLLPQGCKMK